MIAKAAILILTRTFAKVLGPHGITVNAISPGFLDSGSAPAEELQKAGELVSAEGLAPPAQARIVKAGKGGAPEVTDGPFAEAKEFLAGYWIVDVERPEQAYAIAARASAAPGQGGKPMNMPIEVREVMSAPPVEA